jgi:hypothetical protein
MNYPAANCRVSETKQLSFRLVRNLSEEGFPRSSKSEDKLRFFCGKDSERRSRSELRGITPMRLINAS